MAFTNGAALRHICSRHGWQICAACRGRIHERGCTTKKNHKKDCCARRHQELHDAGFTHGLDDAAIPMLTSGVR